MGIKKDVVILYEMSGYTGMFWADGFHKVSCYDILHNGSFLRRGQKFSHWDARDEEQTQRLINRHRGKTKMVIAMPPCTDLAVSGAKHFVNKARVNPHFHDEAMELVHIGVRIAQELECPWYVENPVSVISSLWRKPDHIVDPFEFGGYLPEDDVHPDYPDYIKPRDAYPKRTCLWVGGGFKMPEKKPVPVAPGWSTQQSKLGGKSARTKTIRSASPRGLNRAIYLANR